jgi:uncharacterized protein (DUF4415 family)
MSKQVKLTKEELEEIARLRADARLRVIELLKNIDPEEDARLTAAAEGDPDSRPLTDEDWKRMRPAHEVYPHLVRQSLERKRGRPKLDAPKKQVTLRLDADILDHFKARGAGWQTAINETLRKGMAGN